MGWRKGRIMPRWLTHQWEFTTGREFEVDWFVLKKYLNFFKLIFLDGNLGPYPYESYKQWCGLSNHITKDLIEKLQPKSGRIDSVVNFTPQVDQNNRTLVDRDGLPILDRSEADAFGFSNGTFIKFSRFLNIFCITVGRCWWPADCTSAQRTVYAQDSSWILNELIKKSDTLTGLFGEFQFAYLAFVIGQVKGFDELDRKYKYLKRWWVRLIIGNKCYV